MGAHKKVHEGFVAEVGRIVAKASSPDGGVDADSILPVLKDWLISHIQGTDKEYGKHINAGNRSEVA